MMAVFDVIVIGVGGMGSAVLYELARRGFHVLGLERHGIGHDRGSSHGSFRIIRRAYFEHPDYIPLVNEAYTMWAELEQATGESLVRRVGLVMFGAPDSAVIRGVQRAVAVHDLDIARLDSDEARARFGGFTVDRSMVALYEPDAGYLRVEACVSAHAAAARAHGATIECGARVRGWASDGSSAVVRCDDESYRGRWVVVCPGPWAGELLERFAPVLEVRRKVQLWYAAPGERHDVLGRCPVFAYDIGGRFYYGFPADDGRMKVAEHTGGVTVASPDDADRDLGLDDHAAVDAFVRDRLSGVRPIPIAHSVCFYTMTPDGHFLVGRHPHHANVALAAGFSGHGFKFAPVVGRLLADIIEGGDDGVTGGFLAPDRLGI